MKDHSIPLTNLPPEQEAIRAKCFHPSGRFEEFPVEDVEKSIPDRFEKIVRRYPDRIAVKARDQAVTYAELNAMANRLARTISERSSTIAEPVGVLVDQGVSLMAVMLGVLKAGKFFVLLGPSFPKARIAAMLEDSQAKLLVTDQHNVVLAKELPKSGPLLVEFESIGEDVPSENLALPLSPQLLAYIAYTSGSTGQPKGVVQDHRNILHDTMLRTNAYRICEVDRLSLLASSTSLAVKTALFPLLNGASLLPFDVKKQGVTRLANWLLQERISICRIGAPLFRRLVETLAGNERFPDLRVIQFAGDMRYKADVDLWKKYFSPNCILANSFSSSETGFLCGYLIDYKTDIAANEIPVGYRVSDKEILLLDEAGDMVRDGEIGEIAVRSRYLSPGYWLRPDLTEARFRPDPDDHEARVYLTGDLGQMLPDSCLMYKGRKDLRVKVRGYSVELTEIENALLQHPGVMEAGVVAWDQKSGEKFLAAYIVSRENPAPRVDELRRFLKEKMPDYMIPSAFTFLEILPLTNGKLDRKALPRPDHKRPDLSYPYVPRRNEVEQKLILIWEEVLGVSPIGVDDKFFDLGGHSLSATRTVSRVLDTFRVEVSLTSLFESPTIADMAAVVTESRAKKAVGEENLARVLAEVEELSDEDVERLIAEELHRK